MPLNGMGGWKDVHRVTLSPDTTCGDGGWVEPPGGGKAVWRSSQYDFEDAAVFCPTGLSVQRTTGVEEARSLHGMDRHASRTAMALEATATAQRTSTSEKPLLRLERLRIGPPRQPVDAQAIVPAPEAEGQLATRR